MNEMTSKILSFYRAHARDLPWRKHVTPYQTLVSEIMLQQTRVDTVIPYYERFLSVLPDFSSLAKISEDELLKLWEGLGYYRRAKLLKRCAEVVMNEYNGKLPESMEELRKLPGIGAYTAAAIASISMGIPALAMDGNVERVFTRVFALEGDPKEKSVSNQLVHKISPLIPEDATSDFTQGLMEIGATICLPNGFPLCEQCPLQQDCIAHLQHRELDFPQKKEKPKPVDSSYWVALVKIHGKVWVRKRPEEGLLASMWELPNVAYEDGKDGLNQLVSRTFPNAVLESSEKGIVQHVFTHRRWNMHVVEYHIQSLELPSSEMFLDEISGHPSIPLPTAFSKILKRFHDSL
ncbi:MAG: A/G-specific adenine glycosylase [Candidatus Izemoplasmatales bacterium]